MSQKPWLPHYDPGVPHSLAPYPDKTLLDVVAEAARQRPDHPALIFKGTRVSYAALEARANALAAALVALGVQKGDRVAIMVPNSPQAVIGQLGAWRAGALVVPLNPLYTGPELEKALNTSGATAMLVLTPFYDKVKGIQPRTGLRHVIATHITEYLPPHLRVAFLLLKDRKEGHRVRLRAGDLWLGDLLNRYAGAPAPAVAVHGDDAALLIFTGGTTGAPKAAVGTHAALFMAGTQLHAWARGMLNDWQDAIMLLLPLFHAAGNVGVLTVGLVGHNPLVLVPNPRDLDDVIATVRQTRPAFLPGVPTLFNALLEHRAVRAGRADFSSIKLSFAGAAPLMAETRQRFQALTGGRIVEAYALTESMMAAILGPVCGSDRPGAVGMPLPDVEVRAIPAEGPAPGDDAREPASLPAGEVGEIIIRAPQLMAGYWQQPEETANMLRDGWLYTGDLGYVDEAGYVYIVDRKKDLIKPSGFQVWPREVEEVIASHPDVAEVSVAGIPDPHQGEAVKAWVVLRPGAAATADALRAFCKERLAAYKVPRQVEFRASLPKSNVGKVLRRELVAGEKKL
jgi:long-chain acyl-CoA synthetase